MIHTENNPPEKSKFGQDASRIMAGCAVAKPIDGSGQQGVNKLRAWHHDFCSRTFFATKVTKSTKTDKTRVHPNAPSSLIG